MKPLEELTAETILDDEIFVELMEMADPIRQSRAKVQLRNRAKKLGVKQDFDTLLSGYMIADRQMKAAERENNPICSINNYTNFDGPYDSMFCGGWIADARGVYSQASGGREEVACYHPILPVERLKNLETGEEQIKLAYKRNNRWDEITVPKTMVTSASKIVALSGRGVAVTSENAKLLVKYLSDVENGNDDYIGVQYSTSKLGWHGNDFIPYDTEILFDGDLRFKQIFDAVSDHGSYDAWLQHVRSVRATGRIEAKFLLAASFASVLVQPLGSLPFFVDLWGETEGGKTVALMLAASVWANPDENRFIGDFKTTDVALEAKADMLNHLPMLLDDTSKVSNKIRDNFEGVVYDLCSGKGKSRSNKELGINRENRWRNITICNGERPLSGYVGQGGAINRILEVECGDHVFSDPQITANTVKKHYGHAGREFIGIIKGLGFERIRAIQESFQGQLFDTDKMQKQSISLSVILTADQIVTDYIFKDGQYISIKEAKKALIDKSEVSDNARCYQYLIDKVGMNNNRFDVSSNCEKWGTLEDGYAIFYNQAFDELCRSGGFSKRSFLSWAARNGVVLKDTLGNPTKQKKIAGKNCRCVFLKLDADIDDDGFRSVDEDLELPFLDKGNK